MTSSITNSIAGIQLPDTPLVRDVTEYIRAQENDLLFDHSRRVFFSARCRACAGACSPIWNCSTSAPCSTTSA